MKRSIKKYKNKGKKIIIEEEKIEEVWKSLKKEIGNSIIRESS